MKIAVISDIHGNLDAFREVLADIKDHKIEQIVCLGDTIGYGPEPEESVRLIQKERITTLMGNHEMAVIDPGYGRRLNPTTKKSILITKGLISEATKDYCKTLPHVLVRWGARFVHGCPPESVTKYLLLLEGSELKKIFSSYREWISFAGHTHTLGIFEEVDGDIRERRIKEGQYDLDPEQRYIINVGSVGQPRDSNNKQAKYVIWDTDENRIEVRYVKYDASATAEKIIELGFPSFNAERLL